MSTVWKQGPENERGEATVWVTANKRLHYDDGMHVTGSQFTCEVEQAKDWIKNGTVSPVLATADRPTLHKPAQIDPVVRKVLDAADSTQTEAGVPLAPSQPAPAPDPARYKRRDLRPKE